MLHGMYGGMTFPWSSCALVIMGGAVAGGAIIGGGTLDGGRVTGALGTARGSAGRFCVSVFSTNFLRNSKKLVFVRKNCGIMELAPSSR